MKVVGDSWSFGGPSGSTQGAAGVMTGTTKIVGTWVDISQSNGISWTPRWSGTPTGTFTVEVSNEYSPNPSVDYPSSSVTPPDLATLSVTFPSGTNPAGAYPAAGVGIDIGPTQFKWARLAYTNASGTGVLTARCHTKAFG